MSDHKTLKVSATVPILMYHSVSQTPSAATRALSVRPTDFALQIRSLQRSGFTGLTFGELCNSLREDLPLPPKPVVLTFDDGYADFVEEALPHLMRYGFPATVFVTTGWLRDAGRIAAGSPPDRMLSWRQVIELHYAGVEIGAHSHSHAELDQISAASLRAELVGPKSLLEDRLGSRVTSVAYPYGYSRRHVRDIARQAGYLQAASVDNRVAARSYDLLCVPRLTIRRSTSLKAFERVADQQRVRLHYASTRALTRCWSGVRQLRSALSGC